MLNMTSRTLSLHIATMMLLLAILACGAATTIDNVRIVDLPQFICPTSTPLATHTPLATQVQPDIYVPPSGYATHTPVPGCAWNGSICLPYTSVPGGVYTQPGHYVPGATSTPRPTYTPWPTPTPYVISGGFHTGADIYTGGFASAVSVRLQVDDITVIPLDETRQVVAWTVEIENVGTAPYAALPGGQVFVGALRTLAGEVTGQWWASVEAAQAANITLAAEALDILEIAPGQSVRFTLTAFTPIGEPTRIGWALDPFSGGRDDDLAGGNVAYWQTDASTDCVGNLGSGATIPTPVVPIPSPTPSQTSVYPPWCTWCGY